MEFLEVHVQFIHSLPVPQPVVNPQVWKSPNVGTVMINYDGARNGMSLGM